MSGLAYVNLYGTDSEDSENEITTEKPKLPLPCLDGVVTVNEHKHIDDPKEHSGRARSFPHVRGNWASFVYLKCPCDSELLKFITLIETTLKPVTSVERIEDIHISLSRTVVLQYHKISSFNLSIKEALQHIESFSFEFESVKVYCNEEETRTFIALEVDHYSSKQLKQITNKLDIVLKDFNLPEFYHEPSFHASVLWSPGNKKEEINHLLKHLTVINTQISIKEIVVDTVYSKIGNKLFQYSLQ